MGNFLQQKRVRVFSLLCLLLVLLVTACKAADNNEGETGISGETVDEGSIINLLEFETNEGVLDIEDTTNDDAIVLQAVINVAKEGDVIFIPKGVYNLYSTIILKSGVSLQGEENTVLKSMPINGEYPGSILQGKGVYQIQLSLLKLTSAFEGQFSMDTKTNNPEAAGPKYMIQIEDNDNAEPSYNITIDQVHIEKYQVMGVRISCSHNVVVVNSVFENATDVGGGGAGYGVSIQGEGNGIDLSGKSNDAKDNRVENCQFIGPYLRHGVLLQYYANNNLITNNSFDNTRLDAIDLHGEDEYENEISYNDIKNIETGAGIGVGNTGSTHDKSGPANYIHHNMITNAREGIIVHLGSEDTRIEENTIVGATVTNASGIYLQNAPGTIVKNNTIKDSKGINFYGILLNEDQGYEGNGEGIPSNITIEENIFSNIPAGIKITAGENLLIQRNTYDQIESLPIFDTREYKYVTDLLPSQVLSLVNWKINLPINQAQEIRQPELKNYEHEEFFYVNATMDGVVFNAPCQADDTDGTTANSSYPRSELREMAYGGMAEANWSTDNGTHTMIIEQTITHTPEVKAHVVVGQIHDANDDVVMIRLEDSRLFVEAEGIDVGVLDEQYKIGTRFKVTIEARNDIITVKYNDEEKVVYEVHKEGCYFKAGMYTQSNVSKGDEPDAYGEAIIYNLKVTHSDVTKTITQTYSNLDIPKDVESDMILEPTLDTFVDLMQVDGVITPNVSPRNQEEILMVKTSSGQTTIRLSFLEFDLSQISEKPKNAALCVTAKDSNGASDIMVFGFDKSFGENLVWGDLYTIDSRISKGNSEIMDFLDKFGVLTGEATIQSKDPTTSVTEMDKTQINITDFMSKTNSDVVTLVLVEPVGVDVNMQLYSSESEYTPTLELWFIDSENENVIHSSAGSEDVTDNAINADVLNEGSLNELDEIDGEVNMDVIDINEALGMVGYEALEDQFNRIYLPNEIGKEVKIQWSSSDSSIIDEFGIYNLQSVGKDVTLTAEFIKGTSHYTRTFVCVVPSHNELSSIEWVNVQDWSYPGLRNEDGEGVERPLRNETIGKQLNVLDYGAIANDVEADNAASFQAAIDAAEAGDEVYVPAGSYYFKTATFFTGSYVSHITMKSGVNFVGAGIDETILVSNFDADTNMNYKTTVVLAYTVSDLCITDMTITSNTEDDQLPDPDVSNLNHFVETAPVYALVIDNDKPTDIHGNIVVENLLIEKYQRMGIRIRVVRNVMVSNCTLQKATDLGGGGAGYGISIQGISNATNTTGSNLDPVYNVIQDCTINGPYMRHGILLQYYAHNNLIVGNTVTDTLLDAIDLHGEEEFSNEIAFNTVINTRRGAGIGVGNSGATHDASGPYNYIHNNLIAEGDRGIDILYGTEKTLVIDNEIRDIENEDGTGLFIQNGNYSYIKGNVIENFTGSESFGMFILYSYNALEPIKGIPESIVIQDNKLNYLVNGIYIEAHTENYIYENNTIRNTTVSEYIDENDVFEVPPISDVVIPKYGELLLPSDDNFITNEGRDVVQSQSNMKFKCSYFDIPYNRMIYVKFDLSEAPTNKDKIYLRLTSKSKDGLATINIHGSTKYTDWKEETITWNNALYHEDNVAKVLDPKNELDYVTDFTYTTVGTEFNTYYVDVTEYFNSLNSKYVTLILSDDAVENMYCEIYSKETSSDDQKLALIFITEDE